MAHQVIVPPLGQTTDTVVLSCWYVHVGDTVKSGQPLFAIETDKATLDIEAQADGVLTSIGVNDGDAVPVLSVIGIITAPGEKTDPSGTRQSTINAPARAETSQAALPAEQAHSSTSVTGPGRVFISPRARRFAETHRLDWRALKGSGPVGAIVERDVRSLLAQPHALAAFDIRTAPAAIESSGQGHLSAEIDVSALVAMQARLSKRDVVVSLDSVMLYILGRATVGNLTQQAAQSAPHIGVIDIQEAGYKTHWLEQADRMSLLQVKQALDSAPASGGVTAAREDEIQMTYFNIGNYGLDVADAVVDADVTFVAGQIGYGSTGDEVLRVSLNYKRSRLTDMAAIRLMHSLVQLAEDLDLLF